MKVIAKTDEYTIYQKRSERYAIMDSSKSWVNGDAKITILLEHKLISAPAVKAPEPEPEPEVAEAVQEVTEEVAEEVAEEVVEEVVEEVAEEVAEEVVAEAVDDAVAAEASEADAPEEPEKS